MRILAVGAHPDDLDLLCAGTLARYAGDGHEVFMCNVANGDLGSVVMERPEIAATRLMEAQASAAVIGAHHETLGVSDASVRACDPDQQVLVIDLIRRTQPDAILTHSPNDYMADHNEVSKLVFDCTYFATLPKLRTKVEQAAALTPIYFMETLSGLGFSPTHFVDITPVFEQKRQMLSKHESQHAWLRDHDQFDVLDEMEIQARFRGNQCGVRYAEGFTECLTARRPITRRLLP
jgi:LmbE family N-acetylglucosaminyl deacetylase